MGLGKEGRLSEHVLIRLYVGCSVIVVVKRAKEDYMVLARLVFCVLCECGVSVV